MGPQCQGQVEHIWGLNIALVTTAESGLQMSSREPATHNTTHPWRTVAHGGADQGRGMDTYPFFCLQRDVFQSRELLPLQGGKGGWGLSELHALNPLP